VNTGTDVKLINTRILGVELIPELVVIDKDAKFRRIGIINILMKWVYKHSG